MERPLKASMVVALGFLTLSALLAPLAGASQAPGATPLAAVSIPLYGRASSPAGWGWAASNVSNNLNITVHQGDVITFHLYSADSMDHELVIDLDNSHTLNTGDKNSTVFNSPTTATDFVFTASSAGTFAFFCYLHGYATQHGTLHVEAAPVAPSGDNMLLIVGGVIVVVIIVGAAAFMMRRGKAKPPQQPPQP
jgi:plastocyanin